MKILGWGWFVIAQLISLVATILGFFVLIPFCLTRDWWEDPEAKSIKDGRFIDVWRWPPLNWIYGNPEDGVSGLHALIWDNGKLVPYKSDAQYPWGVIWRAYCWSAWRNSCNNLKYVFAWKNGPSATIFGRTIGWKMENGYNVMVL